MNEEVEMSMQIKVLGPGCVNCHRLRSNVDQAVAELALDANVESVEDVAEMLGYGIMASPAMVVDEQVAFVGRVPDVARLKDLLSARVPG